MKQAGFILLYLMTSFSAVANVKYIDISKITKDEKLVTAFNYIKEDKQYFDHWTHEWKYDVSKQELIKELKDSYNSFSALSNKNEELYLLLGDIGYYLYNLDENSFSDSAADNYERAIQIDPKDYRPYWFLGNHYTFSSKSDKGISNYLQAESLLPGNTPADFWNDYAACAAMVNMPSHCFFAMDKVKIITGREGSFEAQLGPAIQKRMIDVNKDSAYTRDDIWTLSRGEKLTLVSRPLGIKLLIDSTWLMGGGKYANHKSDFYMKPTPIKNKNGMEIKYTIGIFMKTATDTDKLENYVNSFVSKFGNQSKITFSNKYDKMIAYEIKDKFMYPLVGGGHIYVLGIEREAPKYPGLLLEVPATIPGNKSGQELQVYRAQGSRKRFEGRIFYLVILDSCEDIHEQSYSVFKNFFDNQLIIE